MVRTTEGKTATFVADGDLLSTNGISDLGSRLGRVRDARDHDCGHGGAC